MRAPQSQKTRSILLAAGAGSDAEHRAGGDDEALVSRGRNTLGRTMWHFAGEVDGYRRFLILGRGKPGITAARDELRDEHRRRWWLRRPTHRLRAAVIG